MDACCQLLYQLLRLIRSMRYSDILPAAIGVLGFVLFLRRWKGWK